jgi:hypothetical protein
MMKVFCSSTNTTCCNKFFYILPKLWPLVISKYWLHGLVESKMACNQYVMFNVWKSWSRTRPSNTYKKPSWCKKPSQNVNLLWSLKRFWIWLWFFNWPLMPKVRGYFSKSSQIWQIFFCHCELPTIIEIKGVWAFKWHDIVGCRLHFLL